MRDALLCPTEWSGRVAVVHLRGPLRIDTAPQVRAAVAKCLAAEPAAVIIDTVGLDDIDDVALTVFPALARAAAAWPGVELILSAPNTTVRKRLSAHAVDRQVRLAASSGQALDLALTTAGPPVARHSLPAGPAAVTEARAAVRELCAQRRLHAVSDAAEVVACELVTNAVVHARPPYVFAVQAHGRYLHLSVGDATADNPVRRSPDPMSFTGGRGLLMVEAFTVSWGVTPKADGKVVWATLLLRSAAGRT